MANNCLISQFTDNVSNDNLPTYGAITIHVNDTSIENLRILRKDYGVKVVSPDGNYLSLSSDGSNPTNSVDIPSYQNTNIYFLAGKYNVLLKRGQSGIIGIDQFVYVNGDSNKKSYINLYEIANDAPYISQISFSGKNIVGNIEELYCLNKTENINITNCTKELYGSIEILCKKIVESGTRTANNLTLAFDDTSDIIVVDNVKMPGGRTFTISFNRVEHSFTIVQATMGLNRTYTLSGGTWSYVDN